MLDVAGLGVRLGDGEALRWILRDVGFTAGRGEVVAVWGPSGCGKSTLLNLVGGLLVPDEGSILVSVDDNAGARLHVHELSEGERVRYRRRHLGFIFQFFNLVPTLTVKENVLLPLELNGMLEREDAALERLDELGVIDKLDRFPETLSGGEQQRVAIARAMAHAPPLVLADEPTGNLDLANAERVVERLWAQVRNAGATLVIATHNERIAKRADTIVQIG